MNKIVTSIILSIVFVFGLVIVYAMTQPKTGNGSEGIQTNVVSVVDGKQIIDITAKGGYSPRKVVAKAGMPTILRVKTKATFDCSSSLFIPELDYREFLDSTGVEEIEINEDEAQGTINGLCSMGMYSFKVVFE